MKRHLLSWVAASALVAATGHPSRSAEVSVNRPHTVTAARATILLSRATDALTGFVNACADGDRTRIHATLTDDAAIELPLTDLGTFLLIDSANVADYCTVIGTSRHITSLWVYPTGDHAVVASFRQDGGKARLVLLDVREGHIARLREFTADDAQVRATVHQHLNVKDPS